MAAYHIKDKSIPDDRGVIVKAQNQSHALRQLVEGRFEIVTLNSDALMDLVSAEVPTFIAKPEAA